MNFERTGNNVLQVPAGDKMLEKHPDQRKKTPVLERVLNISRTW